MAEFTEVCRQAMRMSEALAAGSGNNIEFIALYISKDGKVTLKGGGTTETAEGMEKNIMQWAAEHPEPVYPTWAEWQAKNFPEGAAYICLLNFTDRKVCDEWGSCVECRAEPIPADIAEKLGIKPIENKGGDGK